MGKHSKVILSRLQSFKTYDVFISKSFFILTACVLILGLIGISQNVYAATYDVSIPSGASDLNCNDTPNACYNPGSLVINAGDSVKWTNNDNTGHTSTSGSGSPDGFWHSGNLPPGQSFTTTISAPGTYPYFCAIHPWQVGQITVEPTVHDVIIPDGSSDPNCSDNDTCFAPSEIIVYQGDIVRWISEDSTTHTIVSGISPTSNGLWSSGILNGGDTFSTTMNTLGHHDYFCSIHPWQVGTVNVVDRINIDPIPQKIQKGTITIDTEIVALELVSPMHMTPAGDQSGRLFIVDQPGQIRIIDNGVLLAQPFLDISNRLVPLGIIGIFNENDYDERGLLGMAFHPQYDNPSSPGYGKIYTYTSESVNGQADYTVVMPDDDGDTFPDPHNHQSVIAEWTVSSSDPNLIDSQSRREVLRVDQPQFNHNGGMMEFGPDGYLYVSFGDGGQANDDGPGHSVGGNAQDQTNILGTIIRIDPIDPSLTSSSSDLISTNGKYRIPSDNPFIGSPAFLEEIYSYGFRNVWRFSFDPVTDQLIAGDVGQNKIEEIDIIQSGQNYGWRDKEGTFDFDYQTGSVLPSSMSGYVEPVAQYDHDEGISITGGYVYRGSAIPELVGKYVFGDFSSGFFTPNGRIFYSDLTTGEINEFILSGGDAPLGTFVKGMGQDDDGELYLMVGTNLGPFVRSSDGLPLGQVLKIIPASTSGTEQTIGQVNILGTCGLTFISGNPLNYGDLTPGSVSLEQTLTLQNTGTISADLFVSGSDWVDATPASIIDVSKTAFYDSSGAYATKTSLDTTPAIILDVAKFTPSTNVDTYWQLLADLLNPSFTGSLTQTMDFSASC